MTTGKVAPKRKTPPMASAAIPEATSAAAEEKSIPNNKRAQVPSSELEPSPEGSSPSKTRIKPSERSDQSVGSAEDNVAPKPTTAKKQARIVFTDDEDDGQIATSYTSDKTFGAVAAEDAVQPEFLEPEAEYQAGNDLERYGSEFIDDTAGVEGTAEVASDGYEHLLNHVVVAYFSYSEGGFDRAEEVDYVESRNMDSGDAGFVTQDVQVRQIVKRDAERELNVRTKKESLESVSRPGRGGNVKSLGGPASSKRDDVVKPSVASSKVKVPVTPVKNKGRAVGESNAGKEEEFNFLSDTEPRGQQGPAVCEVLNVDDMDEIISYDDLPPLFADKHFISWSQIPGQGLAVPSAWHDEISDISMSQVRNVIHFRQFGHMYNPSRMTPSDMGLSPFPGNSYIVPGGTTRPATLTTLILVTSSNIHAMKPVFGEDRRMIAGIPHITEGPRLESAILMTYHLDHAFAQVSQQSISFSTARTMSSSSSSPVKNPSKMLRQPAGASSSSGSPFAKPVASVQGSAYVPVLDARHTRFSVTEKLDRLDTILPTFNAEVPEGSCAWVGYTVNKYTTAKGNYLNFNLLWVVVLGTPA
ncbi:hypothetical protein HWV62_5155 [Athelia sp. TMB]|nr:hypothetical protein HWV62_5155 [Athelia sp. TMB]